MYPLETLCFPSAVFPMNVGRLKSVMALEKPMNQGYVALFCQKTPETDRKEDLYEVGTLVRVLKPLLWRGMLFLLLRRVFLESNGKS